MNIGVISPLHTEAVGVGNIRYFRAPLKGPQQPWHSVEDLYRSMALPRDLRRHFLAKMKTEQRESVRLIQTPDGATTIAPHYMAQGFIAAMREVGEEPPGFEMAYVHGIVAATKVLTEGMSPADSLNYAIAAFRESNGIEGPHPKVEMRDMRKGPQA